MHDDCIDWIFTQPNKYIVADEADATHLESLGCVLGPYDEEEHFFATCVISQETAKRLDELQGRYYWGWGNATTAIWVARMLREAK